jgi:1-acyl-sn-glycerol-3-phosphate acyltransferase
MMRYAIQYIRSLLFIFLMYLWLAILGISGAPFAMVSRKANYWLVHTYCLSVRWLVWVLCGVKTEIRGTPPTGDVIIASKHQSFLDIIMISSVVPCVSFIMKRELKWAPVLGFYAARMGSAAVNRGDKRKAIEQMMKGVEKAAGEATQLVIYPQGTRIAPGVEAPYKIGAAVLYDRLGKPCVPAATNVGVFWPRKGVYRKPGTAVLEFLPPMPPGLSKREFMRELEKTVEEASDKLLIEAGFKPGD